MKITKRFIAGAKCPTCNQLDVLQFYQEEGEPVRECVECGFKEVLQENGVKEEVKDGLKDELKSETEQGALAQQIKIKQL